MILPANDEKVVADYLAADPYVSGLVGTRVFTSFPDRPDGRFPMVVLSRFAGAADVQGWLDHPRIQIESWAEKGDRPAAVALHRVVRAAMRSEPGIVGVHDLGIVTGAEEVLSRYEPDPTTLRPRYILDVRVHIHPRDNAPAPFGAEGQTEALTPVVTIG